MKSAIYFDGRKFNEIEISREDEFEKIIKENSKTLFGQKSIYFDLKNKIDSKTFGAVIPDGFLFDFKDKDNPEFYLVEVELKKHDFYRHIFPQITKFFAFFKNPTSRNLLIEKLFHYIKANNELENDFKKYVGKKEIYKALKDIVENSQNIMIIIDENKAEFQEVFQTYTDTWDKMVKLEILKQYRANNKYIFTMNPDFEDLAYTEPVMEDIGSGKYTEIYHLEDIDNKIVNIYNRIKNEIIKYDSKIIVNPQKYYISLRKSRNFTFIQVQKKRIALVIMLAYNNGKKQIKKHKLKKLSEGIQNFYNGPCFKVTLENEKNIGEIIKTIKSAYKQQK